MEIQAILSYPIKNADAIEVALVDEQGTSLVQKHLDVQQPNTDTGIGRATVSLRTTLGKSGTHALRLQATPLKGEMNVANNELPLQVAVREEPLKLLLIAGTPNYEFRFLKHLLERSTGPDVNKPWLTLTSVLQEGDPRYADQDRSAVRLPPADERSLDTFDVVILIDANPEGLGSLLLERFAERIDRQGTGLLVVAGPKHLPWGLRGTPMAKMIPVSLTESKPSLSDTLGAWKLRLTPFGEVERAMELTDRAWELMPAVHFVVPQGAPSPTAQVLVEGLNEQGQIIPTIVTQRFGAGTIQVNLTDEMFRLISTGTSDRPHEQFWLQSIRRLARGRQEARPDFMQLRARPLRAEADEPVHIGLNVSHDRGTKLTGDVRVRLKERETQAEEIVTLSHEPDSVTHWQQDVERLPAGYWEAELLVPDTNARTAFEVQAAPTEMMRTDGDRAALEQVARLTHGKVIEVSATPEEVLEDFPAPKPISRRAGETKPLWNHPLWVLLVCALLISEWGLRRWWNLA